MGATRCLMLAGAMMTGRALVVGPRGPASDSRLRPLLSSESESEGGTVELAPARASEAEADPPQTMAQCLTQALGATLAAIQDDGLKLMEVEFPPLPADVLDAPDTSAQQLSRANTDLSVRYATALHKQSGLRVGIMYPDVAELERAIEDLETQEPAVGVTLHALRKPIAMDDLGDIFSAQFLGGSVSNLIKKPKQDVDVYVCLTFSAQELPDVEALCEMEKFTKPVILFNLKLDTQRGDLGLPAFPPKDLQWRFLSRFVPVYYLRTRAYSISIPRPPFVVNYQGAIFRVYPGQYQSLLDTGKRYRPVDIRKRRPALGEFKEILTQALKLDKNKKDDGDKTMSSFARTGFKSITWWEEDKEKNEIYDDWRR